MPYEEVYFQRIEDKIWNLYDHKKQTSINKEKNLERCEAKNCNNWFSLSNTRIGSRVFEENQL